MGKLKPNMTHHFTPDIKKDMRDQKKKPDVNRNQPEPPISTIRFFAPKNSDIVDYWHVVPKQKLDLDEVMLSLMEKLQVQLMVYAYWGYAFDVFILGKGVAWGDICQATFDTLKEMR